MPTDCFVCCPLHENIATQTQHTTRCALGTPTCCTRGPLMTRISVDGEMHRGETGKCAMQCKHTFQLRLMCATHENPICCVSIHWPISARVSMNNYFGFFTVMCRLHGCFHESAVADSGSLYQYAHLPVLLCQNVPLLLIFYCTPLGQ